MLKEGIKKQNISVISLILVNLIPLFGILFYNWDLLSVLLLYWFESAVIGFYTILKMLFVKKIDVKNLEKNMPKSQVKFFNIFFKIISIPFFCFHYGSFMSVHLIFIFVVSSIGKGTPDLIPENIFAVIPFIIKDFLFPIISLFISHGISFYLNFIKEKEYQKLSGQDLMMSPYKRIIIMQLTLIFGMFLVIAIKLPVSVMALFIILKIVFDLKAHNKEHSRINKNKKLILIHKPA